jgi:hypothetical protein
MTSLDGNPVRLAMVGGGEGAFIGDVHRIAARMDGAWRLGAGAGTDAQLNRRILGLE